MSAPTSETNDLKMIRKLLVQVMDDHNMKVVHACLYGSRVYGTHGPNSDYDIIAITDEYNPDLPINEVSNTIALHGLKLVHPNDKDVIIDMDITVYSKATFEKIVDEQRLHAIETWFCPKELVLVSTGYLDSIVFTLDKGKLRHTLAEKQNWAWARALGKLKNDKPTPEDEHLTEAERKYIALKSLFHSYRIVMFGIQLGNLGDLTDFTEANIFWKYLQSLPDEMITVDNFRQIYKKWFMTAPNCDPDIPGVKKMHLMSTFKAALPKA